MKRLLPFVVLILLLIAGVCSVPFLLRPESHRKEITDALSKRLNRPVVIGQISMGYWPPALHLGQVAVLKEGGEPVLQIESADASLDWRGLFRLAIVPTDFQLHHWVLTVLRSADGNWDLDDWLSKAHGTSGSNMWPIRQISWKEGEVHWVDRFASIPQELVLGGIEGTWDPNQGALNTSGAFSGIGSPAKVTVAAKGQFFAAQEWAGDIQLMDEANTLTLHVEHKAGSLDVKGGSGKWRLANALAFIKFYGRGAASSINTSSRLLLENWQIHVAKAGGQGVFEHTAEISGGASEIKGILETKDGRFLVRGDMALRDIPAEAVLSTIGETIPLDGKVTAMAKDVELMLSTRTLSSLKGQGAFELKDGHYKLPDISIQKLAKAKTMGYLKKKFPDLETAGLPVARLSAHWQAKDGMVTVDDGFLVAGTMKAGWAGKLDAARQGMDGYVRVQIVEKDPALAKLIPLKYHTQPAYGRLQGTWQEWFLRAIPASKIPATPQAKLRKAISQK